MTNLREGDDGKETLLKSLLLKTVGGDPSHICHILEEGQVYLYVEIDIVLLRMTSVQSFKHLRLFLGQYLFACMGCVSL
jgi:hypothetical protein